MHHLDFWIGGKRLAADLHMIQRFSLILPLCTLFEQARPQASSQIEIVNCIEYSSFIYLLAINCHGIKLPATQFVEYPLYHPSHDWINPGNMSCYRRGRFCICNKVTRSVRGVSVFTYTHTRHRRCWLDWFGMVIIYNDVNKNSFHWVCCRWTPICYSIRETAEFYSVEE